MNSFREEQITFQFPEDWRVVPYDKSEFFLSNIQRAHGVQGVDFIAMSKAPSMILIEVKDYRLDPGRLQERTSNQSLVQQVAKKVRDTLTGIWGAARHDDETLLPFAERTFNKAKAPVAVVFHLEQQAMEENTRDQRLRQSNLRTSLERELSFLKIDCEVVDSLIPSAHVPYSVALIEEDAPENA